MRVLFTGGGTAGHVNPALAAAAYLKFKKSDVEILFVGNKGGMEEKLVPPAGYPIKTITISGFQRRLSVKNIGRNIRTVSRLLSSSMQAKKIIKDFKPDVCVGTGGYVCGPVIREAAKMGIPCVLHESNAFPGVTIKMLAKKVHTVMLSVEDAKKYLPQGTNVKVTGNPIRPEILQSDAQEAKRELGLDERPVILSFGGSLGSKAINQAMLPLLKRSASDGKYQHIHGFGFGKDNANFKEQILDIENCENVRVLEYINNMSQCFAAADLIISRAGAMTVTEIAAVGKASLLIPSPYVAENHQFHNAMSLVNLGGGDIIEEKNLNPESLMEKVDAILSEPFKAKEMGEKAKAIYVSDVNEKIFEVIMKASKSK